MKDTFKENKDEIVYNIINSLLAGGLVFLGVLSSGNISMQGIVTSLIACLIVVFTKFKNYWDSQEKEYTKGVFNFL